MSESYRTTVAQPLDDVWALLTDVEGLLAAVPNATLSQDDGRVTGSLRLRAGRSQMTYRVVVATASRDDGMHRVVLQVHAHQTRGTGEVSGELTIRGMAGDDTTVAVEPALERSGRAADLDDAAWQVVVNALFESIRRQLLGPASPVPPARPESAAVAEPVGATPAPESPAAAETGGVEPGAVAEQGASAGSDDDPKAESGPAPGDRVVDPDEMPAVKRPLPLAVLAAAAGVVLLYRWRRTVYAERAAAGHRWW